MSDFAVRAMLQALLDSTAEEDQLLIAELARRFIISGTTIDANGVMHLGTADAESMSGTFSNLVANVATVTTGNVETLQFGTANGAALTANSIGAESLITQNATVNSLAVTSVLVESVNALAITGTSVAVETVNANTVTGNNIILPVIA